MITDADRERIHAWAVRTWQRGAVDRDGQTYAALLADARLVITELLGLMTVDNPALNALLDWRPNEMYMRTWWAVEKALTLTSGLYQLIDRSRSTDPPPEVVRELVTEMVKAIELEQQLRRQGHDRLVIG